MDKEMTRENVQEIALQVLDGLSLVSNERFRERICWVIETLLSENARLKSINSVLRDRHND